MSELMNELTSYDWVNDWKLMSKWENQNTTEWMIYEWINKLNEWVNEWSNSR